MLNERGGKGAEETKTQGTRLLIRETASLARGQHRGTTNHNGNGNSFGQSGRIPTESTGASAQFSRGLGAPPGAFGGGNEGRGFERGRGKGDEKGADH